MAYHPTAELASFCATLRGEDIPENVRERVRYLLLDNLTVTLRGSLLPSSLAVYEMLQAMGPGSTNDSNTATIFGRGERTEAAWAALANGVASHGLEMDDVENRSSLHPGVVVFPVALALAEQLGTPVADFYAAVVAGYEVTLRTGAALNPASAYERGFHPTAVCGTLGAAAASARLLGLSPEQTNMALGIAGSMAAGSMAYLDEGAWTKRLHPGWACHAGIMAARLAAAGFAGPAASHMHAVAICTVPLIACWKLRALIVSKRRKSPGCAAASSRVGAGWWQIPLNRSGRPATWLRPSSACPSGRLSLY